MEKSYKTKRIKNLEVLETLVGRKLAGPLDQFIYWSLTTNRCKPGETKINGWFARYYSELELIFGCSERNLYYHLNKLEKAGLIERSRKKFSTKTRSLIRVTKKTLEALGITAEWFTEQVEVKPISEDIKSHNCRFKPAKIAGAYKEDINKNIKENNNINDTVIHKSKKMGKKNWINIPKSVTKVFNKAGELLTQDIKQKIWACFCNLQKQNKIIVSNTAEYISWFCFSLINYKHQVSQATSLDHALNILLRLAKSNQFQKPIGFDPDFKKSNKLKETEGEGAAGGYVVAKSKRELYCLASNKSSLEKEKTRLTLEIRTVHGDIKHINKFLKLDKTSKNQQLQLNTKKLDALHAQLAKVQEQIAAIDNEESLAVSQEYIPLYQQ